VLKLASVWCSSSLRELARCAHRHGSDAQTNLGSNSTSSPSCSLPTSPLLSTLPTRKRFTRESAVSLLSKRRCPAVKLRSLRLRCAASCKVKEATIIVLLGSEDADEDADEDENKDNKGSN
jgi:hypothetical protein